MKTNKVTRKEIKQEKNPIETILITILTILTILGIILLTSIIYSLFKTGLVFGGGFI